MRVATGAPARDGRRLHALAYGIERIGLIPLRFPIPSLLDPGRAGDRRGVRRRAHQGRQFAQPAVPLRHARVPAVRGRDAALPVERVRRAGRGRGQDAAGARLAREAARSRHRPAADRRHARHHLAVLGAQAAGSRPDSRAALSRRRCRKARLRPADRAGEVERDHPRQAPVGGRRRWRWSCSRSTGRRRQRRARTTSSARSARRWRRSRGLRPRPASSPACR